MSVMGCFFHVFIITYYLERARCILGKKIILWASLDRGRLYPHGDRYYITRRHAFVDGVSLCGRFHIHESVVAAPTKGAIRNEESCKTCYKKAETIPKLQVRGKDGGGEGLQIVQSLKVREELGETNLKYYSSDGHNL